MRTTKYKMWDGEKIVDVKSMDFDDVGNLYHINGMVVNPSKVKLLQYTGLKDHKGTEIYEGHTIHAKGHYPGEGWYDTGEHEYNFKDEVKWDKEKLAYTCGGYYLHELNIIKIIGNKYQNPELLDIN